MKRNPACLPAKATAPHEYRRMAAVQRAGAADRRPDMRIDARTYRTVATRLPGCADVAADHRDRAARLVAGENLLPVRQLAAADRHRIPRRRSQWPGGAAGRGGSQFRASLGPHHQQLRGTGTPGHFLRVVPAGVCGLDGDHADRRCVQRVRVSGNFVAIDLCADRARLGPARTPGLVPLPDHGHRGATFLLIGIGFLYMMTGTLNMADLAERLPEVRDTTTVRAALAFIIVGLGLKLALFPLHLWLPNAYAYAPNFITVFLAATATKVALYVMLRFVFTVFGYDYSFFALPLTGILLTLAIAGMFAGSWVALFQPNLKRMLAYSSVAQVGYMVLGIALATSAGLTAGILHLFNHALMKGALFMALGTLFWRVGSVRLDDLSGIGREMPWTMTAFALAGLSLIGVPLTAGFVSKWYLIIAAMDAGQAWLVILIVITSLMAIYYVWRVIEAAWFSQAPETRTPVSEAPLSLLIPLYVMVAANFWFGIDTRLSVGGAEAAARALLGGGP